METQKHLFRNFDYLTTITNNTDKKRKAKGSVLKSAS